MVLGRMQKKYRILGLLTLILPLFLVAMTRSTRLLDTAQTNLVALTVVSLLVKRPLLGEPIMTTSILDQKAAETLSDLGLCQQEQKSAQRWQTELAFLCNPQSTAANLVHVFRQRTGINLSCMPIRSLFADKTTFHSPYSIATQFLSAAEADVQNGRWPDAIENFQMAFASYPETIPEVMARTYHLALARHYQSVCQIGGQGESCSRAMKLFWMSHRYGQAAMEASEYLRRFSDTRRGAAWAYFVQGADSEDKGDLAGALGFYQLAYQSDPSFALNLIELNRLAMQMDRSDLVLSAANSLSGLTPEIFTWKPGVIQVEPLSNGWILEGFDIELDLLDAGAIETPFTLYWLPPAGQSPTNEPHVTDERLLSISTLPNAILNAAFEWNWDRCLSVDTNLWRSFFGANECCSVVQNGNDAADHIATITAVNFKEGFDSIRSGMFTAQPSSTYLAGGWSEGHRANSDEKVVTLVHWYDDLKSPLAHSHCSGHSVALREGWNSFRCLVTSPPEAQYGQLELLVLTADTSEGRGTPVAFDDIFLVSLPLPGLD